MAHARDPSFDRAIAKGLEDVLVVLVVVVVELAGIGILLAHAVLGWP